MHVSSSTRCSIPFRRCLASSSVLADAPIPESLRETIKSKFLNEAVREDSRLWKANDNSHTGSSSSSSTHSIAGASLDNNLHRRTVNGQQSVRLDDNHINSATLSSNDEYYDPLDDLNIQEKARYWPNLPITIHESVDPFQLAKHDLDQLAASIRSDLIGTDHAVLNMAASYFFESSNDGGKKVRPMMVLLLSRALADSVAVPPVTVASSYPLFTKPLEWQRPDLPKAQRRLAEISEMIHTASLFHDDVIDNADTRRGKPAAHRQFGSNKIAILAGDYLLARASIFLARLRNIHVVETMSTIIEHLVRGEVMQLRGTTQDELSTDRLNYYLRKNFYKTGSLMANSCKSTAILGNYPNEFIDISYRYGKHVGMAFQLVDDILDFEGTLSQLGKPALSDLQAGLATAPVLFAAKYYPELEDMINRKFKNDGDIDRAADLVFCNNNPSNLSGIDHTKELARVHSEYAMDAILELQPSQHRDSLVQLAYAVVSRTK